ncbi:MAG: GNAT family N-acetyltransferase [Clostridia bacterium]|nr:GNAT family N-acetyltransferase [Clostridia bacterium]
MEIKEFNYNIRLQYSDFIRKYNKSRCLSSLNIQTFSKGKKIFLILEKRFFRKYKIIGYSIVYEDLHTICFSNDISKKYDGDLNTIFISDFMIHYLYRNQGIGKYLARYIIYKIYEGKNIILQPDGDGYLFWKNLGFVSDNISKHITWILQRNN